MSHMAYDVEEDSEGSFDGPCPSSHPVRVPEIQFYFRIKGYEGGEHRFSTDDYTLHADYMSGWNATELQIAMENCEQNNSTAANPDAWCNDVFTFTDEPKRTGDSMIVEKLNLSQPLYPLDSQATITNEAITDITSLPRVACTGTLIPDDSPSPQTTTTESMSPTTVSPTITEGSTESTSPTTVSPTITEGSTESTTSDDTNSSKSDDDNTVVIVGAVGAAIAVILVMGVAYTCVYKTKK